MGKDPDSAAGLAGIERTPPLVDGFKLARWIGGGSYGDVWLGQDILGQWRAVKIVYRARFPDPESYEREFRGIKAYAEIAGEEASLMRVFHAGREDGEGYYYYAMELAEPVSLPFSPETYVARTLKRELGHVSRRDGRRQEASPRTADRPGPQRPGDVEGSKNTETAEHSEALRAGTARAPGEGERRRLPFKQCLVVAREVATALGHLHRRGLVHRDVKPSNIVFIRGEARLADIGLVAKMEMSLSHMGTANYLPQEGAGTPQGDLYALGKVLYEICTGMRVEDFPSLPFLGGLPKAERKGVRELNQILLKACDVVPKRRYLSAEKFIRDLDYVDEGSSLRALRLMKRALWTALGALAVVAVLAVGRDVWNRARSARQLRLLEFVQHAPRVASPDAPWFPAVWSNATEAARIQPTEEVQGSATATLAGMDATASVREAGLAASSVAFDREGRRLLLGGHAFKSATNGAILWELETNRRQTSGWAHPGPVAFGRDGTPLQLVFHEDRRSGQVWDVAGARAVSAFSFDTALPAAARENAVEPVLALSADGSLVAVAASFVEAGTNRVLLGVWEGATGRRLWQTEAAVSALVFSTDGRLLATGDRGGTVRLWRLPAGELVTTLQAAENEIESLALHRDIIARIEGATDEDWLLAAGESGGTVTLWDVRRRIPRHYFREHDWHVYALAFDASGTMLAAGGRNEFRLWNTANGRRLLRLGGGEFVTGFAFSPEGGRLAVSRKHWFQPAGFTVWDLESGRGIASLHGLQGALAKIRFSPDGRRVAALAKNWQLGVWEVGAGTRRLLTGTPKGDSADNAGLAFSADGRKVAFATAMGAALWDLESGARERGWALPPGLQEQLAFHESGKLLLFQVETREPTEWPFTTVNTREHPLVCRVRDLTQPGTNWMTPLAAIPNFNLRVFHSAMTPDGATVIVHGTNDWNGRSRIEYAGFDVLSGARRWSIATDRESSIQLDPAGELAAFATNGLQLLVKARSGDVLTQVAAHWGLPGPKGTNWLAGHLDGRPGFSVMQAGRATPLLQLGTDLPAIGPLAFSPDGSMVAWGGDDGTVYVCRLEEARRRLTKIGLGR